MFEFTIYGIDNDKFRRLLSDLQSSLKEIPLSYKVIQIKDIDEIIKSGIVSIPSIYFRNTLIIEDHIPEAAAMKKLIFKALEKELGTKQLAALNIK